MPPIASTGSLLGDDMISYPPTLKVVHLPAKAVQPTPTPIFSYEGQGLLVSAMLQFDWVTAVPRLVLDGHTVLDGLTVEQWAGVAGVGRQGVSASGANFTFAFYHPVQFTESLEIAATGPVEFKHGLIYMTQEG